MSLETLDQRGLETLGSNIVGPSNQRFSNVLTTQRPDQRQTTTNQQHQRDGWGSGITSHA